MQTAYLCALALNRGWTATYTFGKNEGYNITSICRVDSNGKLLSDLEISYKKLNEIFVPDKWKYSSFSPSGDINYEVQAVVDKVDLSTNLDFREFDISFPAGTVVSDHRPSETGYSGRFGNHLYISQDNGEKRTITDMERSLSYAEILQNPMPSIRGSDSRSVKLRLLFLVNGTLAAIFLACYWWKRRQAK